MGSVMYLAFSIFLMLYAGTAGADDPTAATPSTSEASTLKYGAPLPSSSELGVGSPLSSQGSEAGSGNGGTTQPKPGPGVLGPDKPGPRPPGTLGPRPDPPKPKDQPKGGSSSSSSSLLSPASSPSESEDISPIPEDLAPSPELSDDTPAQTPLYSPPAAVVGTPLPVVSTPPPPSKSSSSHPPKVLIKGRVSCNQCRKRFDRLTRRTGLQGTSSSVSSLRFPTVSSGVAVELSCPDTRVNVTSGHHGVFKIELHYQVPAGFPNECTVSVLTSTLPQTCNVPVVNAASTPVLHETTGQTDTYTVSAYEFSPPTCGQKP